MSTTDANQSRRSKEVKEVKVLAYFRLGSWLLRSCVGALALPKHQGTQAKEAKEAKVNKKLKRKSEEAEIFDSKSAEKKRRTNKCMKKLVKNTNIFVNFLIFKFSL
uniref:Uncharacterized protein n=1 Tax=Pediastrum duplex TaxID=3105 RepID=A0A2U8GI79_PEDDU|nr:hypothetical protein [Pediastrum duplex]